jgi:hypothetical protein
LQGSVVLRLDFWSIWSNLMLRITGRRLTSRFMQAGSVPQSGATSFPAGSSGRGFPASIATASVAFQVREVQPKIAATGHGFGSSQLFDHAINTIESTSFTAFHTANVLQDFTPGKVWANEVT